MQFISTESNTFGFSLSGSIFYFSLAFPGIYLRIGRDWNAIKITDTNYTELEQFCEDFGFMELAAKLSEFRPLMDFKESEDADARGRIAVLEEDSNQHSHVIAILEDKVTHSALHRFWASSR
jgi:hypothetical protein